MLRYVSAPVKVSVTYQTRAATMRICRAVVAVVLLIVFAKVYFTNPPEDMSEVSGIDDKDVDDELPDAVTFPEDVWLLGGF